MEQSPTEGPSEKVPKMTKQVKNQPVWPKPDLFLVSPGNFKPKIGGLNSV
jgi:hypothetical protein